MTTDDDDFRTVAQNLLRAIDANDAANIHGWSVALRKLLADAHDVEAYHLTREEYSSALRRAFRDGYNAEH